MTSPEKSNNIGKKEKDSMHKASQRIEENFFQTPTFQALSIGFPFCVFKLLFGLLIIRTGAENIQVIFGWLVILWASVDLLMNFARALLHLAGRKSPIEYCTIAQIGRFFRRPRFFLAIDTFLSFSIISFVLWSGWIKLLIRNESYLWYAATTLNLMGISIMNLWLEYRRKE